VKIKEGKGVGGDEERSKQAEERKNNFFFFFIKNPYSDFFVFHPRLNSVLQLAVQVSLMSSVRTCFNWKNT